ncbi:MAG: response regulator [Anaerolineae bacterium]|nr:response regulator [Anaerolineae bacterium]
MAEEQGQILVVDDSLLNRRKLSLGLEQQGHTVTLADNGKQALHLLQQHQFDLVLLDILMPEMDGYQVLAKMKQDSVLRDIPVIVISALDEIESAVKCIEMGAEDYLLKPFNPILLKARIGASLEKKRLRDQEQAYLEKLQIEQEKSERLLLNILPKLIADRLKQGQSIIADSFDDVTVLFADIVGFTTLSSHIPPTQLVNILNEIFSMLDQLTEKHNLEKIKTIGDAYMVVGGLPTPRADHARAIADMALEMQDAIAQLQLDSGQSLNIRTGIHTGPVVAGVIGAKKFSYDLWGDTVNLASRMESHGVAGCIQVTQETYSLLKNDYTFESRGLTAVKGKGNLPTFFLTGRK